MAKNFETEQQKQHNIVIVGTTITGTVNCSGDIRVDGTLDGTLIAQGRVVIGPTGVVKGEITCKNSQVEGKVEGKVTVAELLSLKASSSILGDISTGKLAIEPGASFTGNCKMSSGAAANTAFSSTNDQKKK
ncbi:MAG: polymer-forming cytoskeletal protein [Salinivirgaceae bacterium]|nr:polymer-forming cytoskeletal protein [Salinivirgaceae bacterium]